MTPEGLTLGQKAADRITQIIGSWTFLVTQSLLFLVWMVCNSKTKHPLDPYPFILLNLVLSFSAAYANSIILMAQNRQSERDRIRAEGHFLLSKKSEEQTQTILNLIQLQNDLLKELVSKNETETQTKI